jgi:hypothetical protein
VILYECLEVLCWSLFFHETTTTTIYNNIIITTPKEEEKEKREKVMERHNEQIASPRRVETYRMKITGQRRRDQREKRKGDGEA